MKYKYRNVAGNLRIMTRSTGYFLKNPLVILFYALMAVILAQPVHGINVILGLPYDFFISGYDYIVFGRWLLITTVPVIIDGLILTYGNYLNIFIKIRLRSTNAFCKIMASTCIAVNMIWGFFLALPLICEYGTKTAFLTWGLLQSNLILWESIQIFVFYWRPAGIAGASSGWIILLLNGFICVMGKFLHTINIVLPSYWGMLSQSGIEKNMHRYCMMVMANLIGTAVLFKLLHERE